MKKQQFTRGAMLVVVGFMSWGLFVPGDCCGKITKEESEAAYDSIEVLTEALLLVKKHYVEEKTYEKIVQGALNGLLRSLDSHSAFLEQEAYSDMMVDTEGKFGGIGIRIGVRHGVLTVIAPIEDTPAFKVGLQAGDKIMEIEGEKTTGMNLRDAIKMLRGPKGEAVKITIWRQGEDDRRDVEIVRADIDVPSVKGTRMLDDGVGYTRITNFSKTTAEDLEKALDKLEKQEMKALVLDLRNNPGGLLSSAVHVSGQFLKRGKVVVMTRGRKGSREDKKFSIGNKSYADLPLAVLVNGGSASASEIVAGALQDHKRAVILGSTTYGKGSVQSVIPMQTGEGTAMRLTTARYYTPSGRQIHHKGLDPDIPVYVPLEEWRKVQVRRAHVENPGFYEEDEKKEYGEVIDRSLRRAVDLLKALEVFKDNG